MTFPIRLIVRVLWPAFLIVSAASASHAYASGPIQSASSVSLQVDRLSRVVQTPEYDAFAEVVSLNAARIAVESAGVVRGATGTQMSGVGFRRAIGCCR
ncbi:MAG: hypothetical protein ACO3WN_02630 [Burkholderiaceae bacterium]